MVERSQRTWLPALPQSIDFRINWRNRTFLAFVSLAIIAILYDRLFFNYYQAFLLDDGNVALIAEKFLNGERPYVDFEPGYGILWFLPITLLFKIFGVKFFLVRTYFLGLALASSFFAHGLLLRLTNSYPTAFATALVVLLFPGCLYQTYIPFLVISGAYVLLLYDPKTLAPRIRPSAAITCNGLYLGLAYLIRSDVATAYTVLFVCYHGLLVLRAAIREGTARALLRLPSRVAGVVFVAGLVGLVFALEARSAGYLAGFLGQYSRLAESLIPLLQQRYLTDPSAGAAVAHTMWPRPSVLSFFSADGDQVLILLTYFPILAFVLIGLFLTAELFRRGVHPKGISDFIGERANLLLLTGCAASAFPQFFIWRPDLPHLAGFVPGFVALMAYFLFLLKKRASTAGQVDTGRHWQFWVLGAICSAYLIAFAANYEDGLNLRRDRLSRLRSDRGVDVRLNWEDFEIARRLNSLIRAESRPDDFVLAFPYLPGVNFFTGRPTFLKSFYVDDRILIRQPDWLDEMQRTIELKKPRIIVIHNWAPNMTDISRFRNWASSLYDYIGRTYELRAKIFEYEVFVARPEIR